jgi:hypothetical protein
MNFDVGQLRRSHWLIGGGAVALFIFTFLFKWFGASVSTSVSVPGGGPSLSFSSSVNGWHSLTNTRWLLLLTIIAAALVVVAAAGRRELSLPVSPSAIVAGLAGLSAIFVLYRIVDHPHGGASNGFASFSYGAKIGLYLGFIACLVIAYGGYLAMRDEGTSLSDVRAHSSPESAAPAEPSPSPEPPHGSPV